MKRLIIFLIIIGLKLSAQTNKPLEEWNNECIRVGNNRVKEIEQGIDTSQVIVKKLKSKKYDNGSLKYYKTSQGYFKIVKTYTIDKTIYTETYYSLGQWPVYAELGPGKPALADRLYYDKSNPMVWIDKANKTISFDNELLYRKGQEVLAAFEKLNKIAGLRDETVKEE